MRVCFYLDNNGLEKIDFSEPMKGNPGIGGTEFMIWTISYYLTKLYNDIEIILLAPFIDKMPKDLKCIKCKNQNEALKKCQEINGDIFVFKGPYHDKYLFDLIDELKIKSIMWSHNFESLLGLKYALNCKYLKRNICVGREQYHKIMDHEIFEKSTYIYNCLDFSQYKSEEIKNKDNIVSFVGGLRNTKGFHILAEVWKDVIKEVPDAKLYVMGGAKLYDRNIGTGKFGLADKEYEERFMKYILDDKDEVLESVNFLGVLHGNDKMKVMKETKVGITNPSGFGETFCISAIEFEALGVPVVSSRKNGLIDTVPNKKCGILVKSKKDLSKAIIKLLKDNNLNKELGKQGKVYVRENFDVYKICNRWREELELIYSDLPARKEVSEIKANLNLNWFRKVNRNIKKISLFKKLPTILEWEERTARFRKI